MRRFLARQLYRLAAFVEPKLYEWDFSSSALYISDGARAWEARDGNWEPLRERSIT